MRDRGLNPKPMQTAFLSEWKQRNRDCKELTRRVFFHKDRKPGMRLKFSKGEYVVAADGSLRKI